MAEITVTELVARLRADISDFQRGMGEADKTARSTFGKIQDHAQRAGQIGRTLTYGVTLPIVGVFAAGLKELQESQAVAAQTQAVLKSTGAVAGVTATHIAKLSDRIANLGAVDDEAVQSGANLLLTFRSIRNEAGAGNKIFDRSLKLSADLSRAWGQDMKSSAIQLGKALEDPISGLTSLRRVGIQFTDAQEAQIRSLVESGNLMKAQKVILRELEVQVGGSAKAYGETLGGQVDRAKEAFKNATADLTTAVIPALTWLAEKVAAASAWFQSLSDGQKEMIGVLALLVAGVGPLLIALSAIAAHPVILALMAIVAAGYLIITNWEEISAAAERLWAKVGPPFEFIYNALKKILNVANAVRDALDISIPGFGGSIGDNLTNGGNQPGGGAKYPQLASGGTVAQTGLAVVHKGENWSGVGADRSWSPGGPQVIQLVVDGRVLAEVAAQHYGRVGGPKIPQRAIAG